MNAYLDLINQIDRFIRKYYLNKMLKGVLFFLLVFSISYLLVTTLEFFGRFNSFVRAFLLFSFIIVNGYIFIRYFWVSLMKLLSFGKQISHFQAAEIIGQFFPDVSDKLLNTLQLNESINETSSSVDLLKASINQRSKSFSKLNFSSAIDLKKDNKKYIYYLIPLFFVFLTVSMILPDFFSQSSTRVWHFNKYFKPKAPFKFILPNKEYIIQEGEHIHIDLKLKGKILPERVFIVSQQGKYLMNKRDNNSYDFDLNSIISTSDFYFIANDFESDRYQIKVLGKSAFKKLAATLIFPSYLDRPNEIIENVGDLIIPEGTVIHWNGLADNVSSITFKSTDLVKRFNGLAFDFESKHYHSSNVEFLLRNKFVSVFDTLKLSLDVVKDAYPSINVSRIFDSIQPHFVQFSGLATDDIGLNSLNFHYNIKNNSKNISKVLSVQPVSGSSSAFNYGFNFLSLDLQVNDEITYYFEVTDNDAIHGGKSARSVQFIYQVPSLEELNDKRDDLLTESNNSLQALMNKTSEFGENVNRLKKDVLNAKRMDFSKMNQVKQLQQQQQDLQKEIKNIQQQLQESNQALDALSKQDQELLEKQEMLEELLNQVMDDELMNLLDQLEDLLKENKSKNEIKDKLENIQLSSDEMNRQLDRSIEQLKKLQVNEKIDALEEELKQLSEEQDSLANEVDKESITKEEAIKQQNDIDKKFDKLMNDLDEIKKLNNDLSKPMELGNQDAIKQDIQSDMNDANDKLSKSKNQKASESQKSAADNMEKLASDIDFNQKESNQKDQEEDLQTLRSILDNLITQSFNQENLRSKFINVKQNSSSYGLFVREQQKIIASTHIIEDSLFALAKRQPKISSFVDNELSEIKKQFNYIVEDLDEHRKSNLAVHQQTVMTSLNNLALLLNESLQQMQQEMRGSKSGSGSCDNPSNYGSKPKSGQGNIGDLKDQLKKQLDQMKIGNKPGGSNPGDGQLGMSAKDFSKMAAQQAAIRQRLESLRNELNKDGKGSGNMLNPLIQELEQQEKDLINKNLNPSVINRQQQILTRLLESEKALMERGFDNKRESKEGKTFKNGNQIQFDEYTKQKLQQIEMLKAIDPIYEKYYKDKAYEYFNRAN